MYSPIKFRLTRVEFHRTLDTVEQRNVTTTEITATPKPVIDPSTGRTVYVLPVYRAWVRHITHIDQQVKDDPGYFSKLRLEIRRRDGWQLLTEKFSDDLPRLLV